MREGASRPLAVGISGSPRTPSRSKTLAELLLKGLSERGYETSLIDLALLPADALLARAQSAHVDDAIAAAGEARIVIAATPTYRALYSGLLKAFFDLMPQGHLRGKVCIGLQTGTAREHYLSPDYGLRPLFASLEGIPVAGIYATDDEFVGGAPSARVLEWVSELAGRAIALSGQASTQP